MDAELEARAEVFNDSPELADKLREIARRLPAGDAYYLNEAAVSLDGLWECMRPAPEPLAKRRK